MNSAKDMKGIKRAALPLLILAVSLIVFAVLTINKREPEARVRVAKGVLVRVQTMNSAEAMVLVRGHGTVQALRDTKISPQISGRVEWKAPSMLEGGFFKQGEAMFRIDSEDYGLKVDMARAKVALQERDLHIAQANSRIALQEWEVMKKLSLDPSPEDGKSKDPSALVLYKPQLKSAQASLAAAKAELSQAELNFERTTVKAPFNCFVAEKSFDEGQFVNVGETAARVVGTDAVEVVLPVSLEDKSWIQRGLSELKHNSLHAKVTAEVGGLAPTWEGEVNRILGDVDPRGRMHRIVVRVKDPYFEGADQSSPRALPLSVGMFAKVEIAAAAMQNVYRIPRAALRENSTVWLADSEDALEIRSVEVERLNSDYAFVRKGLAEGDRLVLSNITGAVHGLSLRTTDASASEASL